MIRTIARVLLVAFVVIAFGITLSSDKSLLHRRTENALNRRSRSAPADIIGNVALFVPIGALGAAAFPNRRRLVAAAGPALSAGIEVYQAVLLPARDGSPRDFMTNSAGHLLGVGLVALVLRHDPNEWLKELS